MTTTTGRVPLLDPDSHKFPDRFAPESVGVDAAAAATARTEAVEAASAAVAARDEAVDAAERAEAVPAQVDTAMAAQVGAGGEFDTKLSATIVQQVTAITPGILAADPTIEAAFTDVVEAQAPGIITPLVGQAVTDADLPALAAGAVAAEDIPGQVTTAVGAQVPDAVTVEVDLRVPPAVDAVLTTADIPGQVAIALAAQAGKIVQGTGSPEGIVTAAPGTLYVDTAATLGASVWRKASGTAKTGWTVMYGDTGWRNITSLSTTPDWTAVAIAVRRLGEMVTLQGRLTRVTAGSRAALSKVFDIPTGFRGRDYVPHGVGQSNQANKLLIASSGQTTSDFSLNGEGTWVAGEIVSFEATFMSRDPWPASLPGTPA